MLRLSVEFRGDRTTNKRKHQSLGTIFHGERDLRRVALHVDDFLSVDDRLDRLEEERMILFIRRHHGPVAAILHEVLLRSHISLAPTFPLCSLP